MEGISLIGCRENNLKNIDVHIPYSKIISFIGVSGSGKSSIVFDTLYAEGKRRYIESLGVNEAYFISKIKKPDADYFRGLPPAIALAQSRNIRNPRSNVGTISQASYYLQVLFSTCGRKNSGRSEKYTPSMFNLNSPQGICLECDGNGYLLDFDESLIWPNQSLSIAQGGLKLGGSKPGTTKYNFLNSFLQQYGYSVNDPIMTFSNEAKVALLYGQKKSKKYKIAYPGIINDSEKIYKTTKSFDVKEDLEKFMKKTPCNCCEGTGYNPSILDVFIDGHNITYYMGLPIQELRDFIEHFSFGDNRDEVFSQIKKSFNRVLDLCNDLGVGYLSLSRNATTLSGGELQRLKIVAQISSEISGVVYVLDEPSTGLHYADLDKILYAIKKLNTIGNKNTIVLVEHSAKIIKASDYVFELGPGAGENGGEIVFQGSVDEIIKSSDSNSGLYLSGKKCAGQPNFASQYNIKKSISVIGAFINNLKSINVCIPLCCLVSVTGVSGSGKTSLVFDALCQSLLSGRNIGLNCIDGREQISKLVLCDQSTIGTSTRSCPITYIDAYTSIRKLFAGEDLARKSKLSEKHFSFNVTSGRCETCNGEGIIKINMGFMPEMTVVCDDCNGERFKKKVLAVKYKGKSINDVLNMRVTEAIHFFKDSKAIVAKLKCMERVGLGYLCLGQSTSTLSGGESQRLKLAYELSKTGDKGTLIVFDEPTKGLHFEDVKCLIGVMKELVHKGNSIIVVEHNLDMIASSDYVIDVGPGAGNCGGEIIGEGTPVMVSKLKTSTGIALKEYYHGLQSESKQ